MIMTGRAEFADVVWSLFTAIDRNVRLGAMRAAPRIRAGVLSANVSAQLKLLDDDMRGELLNELILHGDMATIELAVSLAQEETSDKIRTEIIRSLMFRRAERLALNLLKSSEKAVWRKLAASFFDGEIEDAVARALLQEERHQMLHEELPAVSRLRLMIGLEQSEQSERQIIEVLASSDFSESSSTIASALQRINERFPRAMQLGVVARIEAGLDLPWGVDQIVENLPEIDEGPVVERALSETGSRRHRHDLSLIIGAQTVGKLMDRIVQIASQMREDRVRSTEYHDLYYEFVDRVSYSRAEPFLNAIVSRRRVRDVHMIATLADLIGRHRASGEHENPLRPSPETAARVHDVISRWCGVLLGSSEATRHDFARMVGAISRLPDERHVPAIARFLELDLKQWRNSLQIWRRERRHIFNGDTSMSYGYQYRRALAAIGGDAAALVAASVVLDDFVGVDFAHCLRDIYYKRIGVERTNIRWPDFDSIAETRRMGNVQVFRQPIVSEAKPIIGAIEKLVTDGSDESQHRRALNLAFVAFQMPCDADDTLISRLLELPCGLESKLPFITILVSGGFIPAAELLLAGIQEWFELADKEHWRRQQCQYQIVDWLQLLPFSNRPAALLDALDQVASLRLPEWELRPVMSSLAAAPGDTNERLIVDLARMHPRIAESYEWLTALVKRGTRSAILHLVDVLNENAAARKSHEGWYLTRALEPLVQADPELRATLLRRYTDRGYAACRSVIEQVLSEVADKEILLVMIRVNAASGRSHLRLLNHATECAVTVKRPLGGNSYEIEPASAAELRRELFALMATGGRVGDLARVCLDWIDHLRDTYGAFDEARHPDIASGVPWPFVAPTGTYPSFATSPSSSTC